MQMVQCEGTAYLHHAHMDGRHIVMCLVWIDTIRYGQCNTGKVQYRHL
jgi:hypothetical protein